jgi:hypothetical protein
VVKSSKTKDVMSGKVMVQMRSEVFDDKTEEIRRKKKVDELEKWNLRI